MPHVSFNQTRATLIGGIAILLWALLALLTSIARGIPPFQLLALTFGVACLVSLALLALRGREALARLRQPLPVWLTGVGGLFGYHFFYFVALNNAPPVEVSLIAYLWPLLIVLFGGRLRWFHLAGALCGLAGAVLLVTRGGQVSFQAQYALGYAAALACAFTWSSYSVINRRFGQVSTEVVAGFCGAVAALGLLSHILLEQWVTPAAGQWLAILGLGIGPVGLAFFAWDHGTKHGSLPTLGALSYGAPLLSTLLLIAFGQAEASWAVGLACALIVGGALLASRGLLRPALRGATAVADSD
ncbi:MAG TPA: DMT family transporter [Candidatus Competibacteraceae bacterium]|nr:DMT family transporter [Candidatus Competibacteraceae bacterium]